METEKYERALFAVRRAADEVDSTLDCLRRELPAFEYIYDYVWHSLAHLRQAEGELQALKDVHVKFEELEM